MPPDGLAILDLPRRGATDWATGVARDLDGNVFVVG
jgi:hypothetical protein